VVQTPDVAREFDVEDSRIENRNNHLRIGHVMLVTEQSSTQMGGGKAPKHCDPQEVILAGNWNVLNHFRKTKNRVYVHRVVKSEAHVSTTTASASENYY
jgi:hypothetical protein